MKGTPRGYHDPMRPLAVKGEWELNETLDALAQSNRQAELAERDAHALARRLDDAMHFQRRQAGTGQRVDIGLRQLTLRFIGAQHGRLAALRERQAGLERERQAVLQRLGQQRRHADALERHRADGARRFEAAAQTAALAEADDIWLQRMVWRARR